MSVHGACTAAWGAHGHGAVLLCRHVFGTGHYAIPMPGGPPRRTPSGGSWVLKLPVRVYTAQHQQPFVLLIACCMPHPGRRFHPCRRPPALGQRQTRRSSRGVSAWEVVGCVHATCRSGLFRSLRAHLALHQRAFDEGIEHDLHSACACACSRPSLAQLLGNALQRSRAPPPPQYANALPLMW